MQTGSRNGMQTMEQSLADLVLRGIVSADDALNVSTRRDELVALVQHAGVPTGRPSQPPSAAGSLPATQAGLRLAEV